MLKNFSEQSIQDKIDLNISRGLVNEIQRDVFQRVKDEFGGRGDYSGWIASWVMANQKENGGSLRSLIEQELSRIMTEHNETDENKLRNNSEVMSGITTQIYEKVFADLVSKHFQKIRNKGVDKSESGA